MLSFQRNRMINSDDHKYSAHLRFRPHATCAPILGSAVAFHWEELGILKDRRETPAARRSALNPHAENAPFAIRSDAVLDSGPAATQIRVPSKLLVFGRTTIHFCFRYQVDWQEYSEFRKSALLALSASAIGKNGQLGIFRNSEYRTVFR
jgi:hypothetical protein